MKITKQLTIFSLCICLLAITNTGCKTTKKAEKAVKNASKTVKGTIIGAGGGALAGAIIGKAAGSTTTGAIIGAAVGGAAGAAIGHYMDREAQDLSSQLKNAKVERVSQGIKITFNSGILFDFNSAQLRSSAKEDINNLASVLKKYKNTKILMAGYTDSKGSSQYNLKLSKERAKSVALYTAQQGINAQRMIIKGYGENNPVADNSTAAGRQKNRRVEIALYANKKLKKLAKEGKIG
ncbi:MAG TPA: OmpA family protein, partial [Balneolaceae bacterium]|nr:OmpA family protein [Balneolaceae bacterium]